MEFAERDRWREPSIQLGVPTVQGRTHGITLVQYVREPVMLWAADPAVSVRARCAGQ